jgi:two-component system chemotaxis response regulator CheY
MKYALVVDDSSVIRKVARRILEGMSFEVQEAKDGKEAYDICLRRMPDTIIVDQEMPVMNGYEFLRSLRSLDHGLTPRVLFCTTENDVSQIAKAIHSGADEYLLKPFDRALLTKKMAEIGMV